MIIYKMYGNVTILSIFLFTSLLIEWKPLERLYSVFIIYILCLIKSIKLNSQEMAVVYIEISFNNSKHGKDYIHRLVLNHAFMSDEERK